MKEITLKIGKKIILAVTNGDLFESPPSWTVTQGDSTVEVSEDGLFATIRASAEPGDTRIEVSAPIPSDDPSTRMVDTYLVHVIAIIPDNFEIEVGGELDDETSQVFIKKQDRLRTLQQQGLSTSETLEKAP